MTAPRLALDSPYGRLYAHPNSSEDLTGDVDLDLAAGRLVPSVTNVIGILEKPHLYDWYARKATEAAMDVTFQHPGLIAQKPSEARKWLAGAAKRHMNEAADLGTRVHLICEALAKGESDVEMNSQEEPYVAAWRSFMGEMKPEYLHVESTVFGHADGDSVLAGYGGTADFIAKLGEFTVVGDLKTGRSIHTEAAIQLNALAAAKELVLDDDTVVANPQTDFGLVVHLGKANYSVRVVPLTEESRSLFARLRGLWNFHATNNASSKALLMSPPLSNQDELLRFADGLLSSRV